LKEAMTILEFEIRLREALVAELDDWRLQLSNETMAAFDLGCAPWHGFIEPSFLTVAECSDMPGTAIWKRVGDWRLYNFADSGSGWQRVKDLGTWMQEEWTGAVNHANMAETFFRVFASVVMSDPVVRVLNSYRLADDFQVGVIDSDDPHLRNFCGDWKELVSRHSRA
jgi:hypothetical protein